MGILGAGAIGARTGALCSAFGAEVLAYKRHITGDEPSYLKFVSLDELLQRSDILSLHTPLTEQTKGLVGEDTIKKMKDGAILINTARGPIVDSAALAKALKSGKLGGAGIDVFENEPPIDTTHVLFHTPNTIVTPHVAFATAQSMRARAKIVFENLSNWMEGNQTNVIL